MNFYTYEISPIDMGWENLKTVRETAIILLERDKSMMLSNDFIANWELAKEAARNKGWDGDFRVEPVVIWIPNDTEFLYGFVFKQDNNGTTYVVTPIQMPWLDELA